MSDNNRLDRIEEKLDKLTDAIVAIARAEEKLVTLEKDRNLILERMEKMDERLSKLESDNNQNKGMGKFVVPFFTAIITGLVAFFFGKYK
jgi:vacuolar-type H+-ATPase subunit E/Vma4